MRELELKRRDIMMHLHGRILVQYTVHDLLLSIVSEIAVSSFHSLSIMDIIVCMFRSRRLFISE